MISPNLHVAIVGASLGGLSAANVLHRLGCKVEVFEAFGTGFHKRGGALGAVDVSLLKEIRGDNSNSYSNGSNQFRSHGHFYGHLWQYLYEGLPKDSVHFNSHVVGIEDSTTLTPTLKTRTTTPASKSDDKDESSSSSATSITSSRFDLIIGADGGKSVVREFVTDQVPTYAGYTLFRGLCSTDGVDGPPSGGKTINGIRYETLGFPVKTSNVDTMWNCGVYMAMPEALVERPGTNRQVSERVMKEVPAWFVPFVRTVLGSKNAKFWEECSKVGKVTPHAVWEFAADRVVNKRILLLGDAAHMASPRTGAGAYTAMVDAVILGQSIQKGDSITDALELYNQNTVQRGKQLYRSSRQAARSFAPLPDAQTPSPEMVLRKLNGAAMECEAH
jgi:2-polyprenyl-6-methoxyphenol hydroxylase-like FAD-dependent oxidoreductase